MFRFTSLLILMGTTALASPSFSKDSTHLKIGTLVENAAGVEQEQRTRFIDALQETYLNSPRLRSARAELSAIQEQLPQALSGWLPSINAESSIEATESESDAGTLQNQFSGESTSKNYGVSLNQSLYRGGKTTAETQAARHVIKSSIANLVALEQDVLLETITAYMNVVQNRALVALSENNRKVIKRQQEATQDRFDVGELTKTDVQQSAARLASAEAQVITTRGALRNSEAIFTQLVGIKPAILDKTRPPVTLPESLDQAMLDAENNNLRVIAATSAQAAADKDVDGIFSELLPQVSLRASWNKSYDPAPGFIDKSTNKAIGIFASIPLYSTGSVRSRVRQAKHTANQRILEINETKRDVRQLATQNWENLITARAEINARKAQTKASEIARDGVRAEAEFGSRTVLDTLDADQELLDAQVELVTAERDKIVAEYALLAVLGQLTPATLGFSGDRLDYASYLENFKWDILNMDVDRVE